jgi:hypothetical protein
MIKDAADLTLKDKRFHLDRLLSLNENIRQKVLHIFIAFHQTDNIDKEKMRDVSQEYMEGMGWGKQPYLVYLHRDALHTHLHVVSSRIRKDDPPIYMYRTNVLKSYELSRQLEKRHGLYQAGQRIPDKEWASLHPPRTVEMGVTPLRPTMNAVLDLVIPHYNYTNLEELNAVLGLYRIRASMGQRDGLIRQSGGLIYNPLAENGKPMETYVKASALHKRPTLKVIEARFTANRLQRSRQEERVTAAIDWALFGETPDLPAFREQLTAKGISLVLDDTDRQRPRLWFVDHQTRAVYDSESLGTSYTAKAILDRLVPEAIYQQRLQERLTQEPRQGQRISGYL